jgi:hypothetical protein
MKFEPGVWAIVIAVLLFYFRLAMIRGKKRKQRRADEIARMRNRRKAPAQDGAAAIGVTYEVANYYLLALGVVLMLAGIVLKTTGVFPMYGAYWWAFVTLGMVAFIFTVK